MVSRRCPPKGRLRHAAEWIDPPLSAAGCARPRPSALASRPTAVDAVYASPLARGLETGRAIAGHHGLEVQVLAELREIELFRDLPEGTSLFDALDPLLLSRSS